jgi:hypothetical protein
LPSTANGVVLVTVAPASVSKVRFWLPLRRKLMVSPPPLRMIDPTMREPCSRVTTSAVLPKKLAIRTAAPPATMMLPELVRLMVPAL